MRTQSCSRWRRSVGRGGWAEGGILGRLDPQRVKRRVWTGRRGLGWVGRVLSRQREIGSEGRRGYCRMVWRAR